VSHLAVVPVAALDASTQRALRYAATLAGRVVALHVADGPATQLADDWHTQAHDVPLVLLEYAACDSDVLLQAIEILKRTEGVDRVTVVVPSATGDANLARVVRPGVVVREVPEAFQQQ
jgi:hypothetical protein